MNIMNLSLDEKIELCSEQVEIIIDKYFDCTIKINGNFPGNNNYEKIIPQSMYDIAVDFLYGMPISSCLAFTGHVREQIISVLTFMVNNNDIIKAIDVYLENLEQK